MSKKSVAWSLAGWLVVLGAASGIAGAAVELGSPAWAPTGEHPVGWRGDGTGRYPGAVPPTTWERVQQQDGSYKTKGIVWAAPMANNSVASPIIVGDKIFLTSEPGDLVCLDKKTGKTLWIGSSAEFEGLSAAERAENPDDAAAYTKLDGLARDLVKADGEVVAALASGQGWEGAAGKKRGIEKKIYEVEKTIIVKAKEGAKDSKGNPEKDKKKFDRNWAQEVFGFAGPTPTSDGKHVFVYYTTGVAACYDLEGRRVWIARGRGMGAEHGNFASPLLIENRLVVWAGEMRGYDAATGQLAWKNAGDSGNTYGSMFRVQAGSEAVAAFQNGYFARPSDGKLIWGEQRFGNSTATPIVENNTIYAWVGYPRNSEGLGFKAYPVPASVDGKLKPALTFKIDWGDDEMPASKKAPFDRGYTASPLYVDGLIYQLTEGGGLTVNDAQSGQLVYRKVLAMKPKTEYWTWAGASASPTLAGKYIYLMDNQGKTIVIKPGKEYEEVASNMLEDKGGGKSELQQLTTPVFEGGRMYYRTPDFLFCIGEK